MLACIACSKRLDGGMEEDDSGTVRSPASKDAVKNLTAQIKDVALRLSGSQRYGKLIAKGSKADVLNNSNSSSASSTPKFHNALEELEEEEDGKEWISEVETGIIITLVSRKEGGNELRRIRFCREMFNKTRAQLWWSENHDKVLALYDVRTPVKHEHADLLPRSENEERDAKVHESAGKDSPVAPPPQNILPIRPVYEHACADPSDDFQSSSDNQSMKSASNSCEQEPEPEPEPEEEREWMEEDEPGVYITIRYSPLTGAREVKRVRFSREKFSEMEARLWWEDNRRRIQKQYIDSRNV